MTPSAPSHAADERRPSLASRFSNPLIHSLSSSLSPHARDESAVPSYTHWNPLIRWLMFRRLELMDDMARSILAAADARAGLAALDFGCGVGILAASLAPRVARLYACDEQLDPMRATVDHFALRNVVCLLPDELEGAIPDASLDLVIAADVLEHVDDLETTLARIGRKLRPGGAVVVSGPTESPIYRLGRAIAGFSGDYHARNVEDVETGMHDARFRCERVRRLPLVPCLFRLSLWRRLPG